MVVYDTEMLSLSSAYLLVGWLVKRKLLRLYEHSGKDDTWCFCCLYFVFVVLMSTYVTTTEFFFMSYHISLCSFAWHLSIHLHLSR